MSKLTRIHVQGLRSLRDVELADLRPVTVLIGPNGSGKSNLLSALKMSAHIVSRSLSLFVGRAGGSSGLLHYGPQETPEMHLRLELEIDSATSCAYDARLGYASGEALVFLDEKSGLRGVGEQNWEWVSAGAGHFESKLEEHREDKASRSVRCFLGRLSYFHFHDTSDTSALRTNASLEDDQHLRSNGSNLAAYLLRLRESEDSVRSAAFRHIEGLVRQVAPFVRELSPTVLEGGVVRLRWVDDRGRTFGPEHLSDGTLRAIALFTVLGQPRDRLPLLCTIDEPELGLHPAALELFSELVLGASHHCQIMLATQSADLLNRFEPEDVVVSERVEAATTFRRLDRESLAGWLADYQLSELYESNVFGGRP